MSTPTLDRARPPLPGPLRPTRFPPFERLRLGNGLPVITVHREDVPLVLLEVLSPAGAHHDPPGKEGLASLAADLLDEGTTHRTAPEISSFIEGLGGGLVTGVSWDYAFASLELQSRHLEEGLTLLAEICSEATFPPEEFERVRRRRLSDLARRRDQPGAQADLRLARELYGEHFVYGGSVKGFEASLEALGRPEVTEFYHRHWVPASTTLVVVGNAGIGELQARAEATLGRMEPGEPGAEPDLTLPTLPAHRTVIVDRPGSSQTELRVGCIGIPRCHADYHAFKLMNTLLGGKFTSRLNLNLRERHGYTYGVFSGLARRRGPGPFTVAAAVATDVVGAAVGEILGELRRLVEEVPSRDELTDTAQYLIGTFPFSLQSIHGVARYLEDLTHFGLPDDYFDHYPAGYLEISPGQVQEVAARHLDPAGMTIVAVGPAEELRGQLEELGPVVVVEPT